MVTMNRRRVAALSASAALAALIAAVAIVAAEGPNIVRTRTGPHTESVQITTAEGVETYTVTDQSGGTPPTTEQLLVLAAVWKQVRAERASQVGGGVTSVVEIEKVVEVEDVIDSRPPAGAP